MNNLEIVIATTLIVIWILLFFASLAVMLIWVYSNHEYRQIWKRVDQNCWEHINFPACRIVKSEGVYRLTVLGEQPSDPEMREYLTHIDIQVLSNRFSKFTDEKSQRSERLVKFLTAIGKS